MGAGNVTNALPLRHCVEPVLVAMPVAADTRSRLIVDSEGSGATLNVTSLVCTEAAFALLSKYATLAELRITVPAGVTDCAFALEKQTMDDNARHAK
jgi:hypothetical protein